MIALYLSKCAMLVFLARITKTSSQIRLYHICNLAVITICCISVLIATVGCSPDVGYYWAFHTNREWSKQVGEDQSRGRNFTDQIT